MRRLLIIALTIIMSRSHGVQKIAEKFRVINGTAAQLGQFPFVVVIEVAMDVEERNLKRCTGSILTETFVLTAAHCTSAPRIGSIGAGIVNEGEVRTSNIAEIKKMFPHPCAVLTHDLVSAKRYDISLFELKSKLTFSYKVRPVALPNAGYQKQTFPNYKVTGVGWGMVLSKFGRFRSSSRLHYAVMNVVPLEKISHYGLNLYEDDWLIRVIGKGTSMCIGDSGGALLFTAKTGYVIIGVASNVVVNVDGSICVRSEFPQTYVRVAPHIKWISDVLHGVRDMSNMECKYGPTHRAGRMIAVSSNIVTKTSKAPVVDKVERWSVFAVIWLYSIL